MSAHVQMNKLEPGKLYKYNLEAGAPAVTKNSDFHPGDWCQYLPDDGIFLVIEKTREDGPEFDYKIILGELIGYTRFSAIYHRIRFEEITPED